MPLASFSHTRGTPRKMVGRTSRMVWIRDPWRQGDSHEGIHKHSKHTDILMDEQTDRQTYGHAPYLQCIWQCEPRSSTAGQDEIDVQCLCGDVGQRKVTDHVFLGEVLVHGLKQSMGLPRDLEEEGGTQDNRRGQLQRLSTSNREHNSAQCTTSLTLSWLNMTPLGVPVVPDWRGGGGGGGGR